MGPKTNKDQDAPGIEPRFLTLKDVATYLNVSEPQAYALVRSGGLPAIKLGVEGFGASIGVSWRTTSSGCMKRRGSGLRSTRSVVEKRTDRPRSWADEVLAPWRHDDLGASSDNQSDSQKPETTGWVVSN
jgi:excisionase family DNA binding protein